MTTSSGRARGLSAPMPSATSTVTANRPTAGVDPGGERGQGAGERDVRQRVGGEDLGPQHQEVADQTGGERRPRCRRGTRSCMNGWREHPGHAGDAPSTSAGQVSAQGAAAGDRAAGGAPT